MAARQVPGPGTAPWERPAPADRAARSEAIERRIRAAVARIADPGLGHLLEGALANTLDTTVMAGGTDLRPDTFVLTGDIDAMWLRDSTAQVWPYLASVRDDIGLDRLIRGVIHRQSDQILLDPYANAFRPDDEPGEWAGDETDMRPGVHERKWEPDSLLAFCRLSAGYGDASGTLRPFDRAWRGALELALRTLRTEQRLDGSSPYRFHRPGGDPTDFVPNDGRGAATRPNGMVHGAFRPSDDASELPLNVPINLALAAALDAVAPLAAAVGDHGQAAEARALAAEIRAGVARDGTIRQGLATGWLYEVDGLGGQVRMDDANVPSLLSLPYLGACDVADPTYVATRGWILSSANPWWFEGRLGDGIGSPHTGPRRIWPIAVAMRGLTAASGEERVTAARLLGASHAGTYLAHESFDPDDPARFTRPWFAWANSLVGEFLERAALDGLLE
ncbi:MAG TPA: glycoside hydrolase family 125 protein [Candidatus Limnocylindrales bacterium]